MRTLRCRISGPFLLSASSASRGRSRWLSNASARSSVRRASAATAVRISGEESCTSRSRSASGGRVILLVSLRTRGGSACSGASCQPSFSCPGVSPAEDSLIQKPHSSSPSALRGNLQRSQHRTHKSKTDCSLRLLNLHGFFERLAPQWRSLKHAARQSHRHHATVWPQPVDDCTCQSRKRFACEICNGSRAGVTLLMRVYYWSSPFRGPRPCCGPPPDHLFRRHLPPIVSFG